MIFSRLSNRLDTPSADHALPGRDAEIRVPATHFVNGASLKAPWPEGTETAIFGMGCFWGAERDFWEIPGVVSTAVGYAGGHTRNPTYEEVCSGRTAHTEAVLVAYDPKQVSYDELLRVFWEGHDPTQGMRQGNDVGTQYRSSVYYTTPAQLAAVEATREAYGRSLGMAAPACPARSAQGWRRPLPPDGDRLGVAGVRRQPRSMHRTRWRFRAPPS